MIAYIEYNDFFYCLKMSTAKTEITEIVFVICHADTPYIVS